MIIIKEASKGYEDVAPIILQGHMDMVCEKTPSMPTSSDTVHTNSRRGCAMLSSSNIASA